MPYNFSILSGSLPDGLSMNGAGLVTGTASTQGTYTWTVQVYDDAGNVTTLNDSAIIDAASPDVIHLYSYGAGGGMWHIMFTPAEGFTNGVAQIAPHWATVEEFGCDENGAVIIPSTNNGTVGSLRALQRGPWTGPDFENYAWNDIDPNIPPLNTYAQYHSHMSLDGQMFVVLTEDFAGSGGFVLRVLEKQPDNTFTLLQSLPAPLPSSARISPDKQWIAIAGQYEDNSGIKIYRRSGSTYVLQHTDLDRTATAFTGSNSRMSYEPHNGTVDLTVGDGAGYPAGGVNTYRFRLFDNGTVSLEDPGGAIERGWNLHYVENTSGTIRAFTAIDSRVLRYYPTNTAPYWALSGTINVGPSSEAYSVTLSDDLLWMAVGFFISGNKTVKIYENNLPGNIDSDSWTLRAALTGVGEQVQFAKRAHDI